MLKKFALSLFMPNIIRLTGDCLFQNFTSKSTTTTTKTFARQNQKNVISGNSSMSALINHLHKTFETHFSSSPSEFSKKHHLQVSAEFFFLKVVRKKYLQVIFPPQVIAQTPRKGLGVQACKYVQANHTTAYFSSLKSA